LTGSAAVWAVWTPVVVVPSITHSGVAALAVAGVAAHALRGRSRAR
jgi:hypothetical protein